MLGAKPYFGGSATLSAATSLPLRVRRRQQAKAGAGAACWCAAAVLPADLCGCGARAEADPPAAVVAIPSPQASPFPLSPRAVCLSRAACALPLVRLTPLPPASAAAVRCAGNGVLRRQWLPTPAHPCHFVIPPVCLVCEPLSNCLLSAQAGGCRCSMRSRNPEVRWRNGGATWLRRMLASYIGDAASCGTSARTTALRYGHRRCELRAPS